MKKQTSTALTQDLFQLMKRLPRLKWKQDPNHGLRRSEYELLVMLALNFDGDKKALSVTELSDLLQITPAGVTHLINSLEDTGYIERRSDPHDRRIVLVGLTNKGARATEAFITEVQENLIGLVNYLGEADSQTLIHLMSRTIEFFTTQLQTENALKQ